MSGKVLSYMGGFIYKQYQKFIELLSFIELIHKGVP